MADRKDPYRGYRFRVEVDGIQQAGFSEASGIEISVEAIEYREGNDPTHVRKLPGLTKYTNITLKWGITDSKDFYDWIYKTLSGDIVRRNMSIILINEKGEDKCRWDIVKSWPTKYTGSTFNATGNEVAFETIEIAHEGITRAG